MIRWLVFVTCLGLAVYCLVQCFHVVYVVAPYKICSYVPAASVVYMDCHWSHWLWGMKWYGQILQWTTYLLFAVLAAVLAAPER